MRVRVRVRVRVVRMERRGDRDRVALVQRLWP